MPSSYGLIVFDWDGTLMDSTAVITRAIQAACGDLGLPVPSDTAASYVIGLGLGDALRHAAPTLDPRDYDRLALAYRRHYFAHDGDLTLFPGVLDMLLALKAAGHRLAVATGKSRQGLNRALEHAELRDLFDATRTADETTPKPHPAMLQEIMEQLGDEPDRTLMVGDTTHDLLMARNAGTAAVAVAYGAHEAQELARMQPVFLADSVPDLQRFLLGG
ncbi:MAG: HAD-IA family hydrolase [Betaproteobacteria bacterium]|jgi:phosphoglycolate phosphatase|uniref:phosphoglycolate phosphatase n=1 Tax=Thiomonas delicata TaxID=364030 RepID=A0A238D5W9_THIDL|nr:MULTISPECIES: HAD-IA family hydrolase [Thiomonas]MDE2128131.1 HAD-IA family hydrolase [Betaproteobacteria bacterium]SBP88631.1 putative phosphoglycolate phosphatase protein [Thiomonas delicata]